MPEFDPTQIAMPLTDMELLNLPLCAAEVGFLQTVLEDFKKRKPFKAFDPMFVRLETKTSFLFCTVLALGNSPEMRVTGGEALMKLYQVLQQQKETAEKKGEHDAGGNPQGDGVRPDQLPEVPGGG